MSLPILCPRVGQRAMVGHIAVEDAAHSPKLQISSAAGKPDTVCKGHKALACLEAPHPMLGVCSAKWAGKEHIRASAKVLTNSPGFPCQNGSVITVHGFSVGPVCLLSIHIPLNWGHSPLLVTSWPRLLPSCDLVNFSSWFPRLCWSWSPIHGIKEVWLPLQREQVLLWHEPATIYFFKQYFALLVSHMGLVPSTFPRRKWGNLSRGWSETLEGARFGPQVSHGCGAQSLSSLGVGRWPDAWWCDSCFFVFHSFI